MKKTNRALTWALAAIVTAGIGLVGCKSLSNSNFNKEPVQLVQTLQKENLQVSDEQHKKDLEFITNYMITFRDKSEYKKNPIPSIAFVDEEILEEIKKGKVQAGKPYSSLNLSYNIDANALFVTERIANEKRTDIISEKRYADYNSDGLKNGTKDGVGWIFYHPELKVFVTEIFDFSKEERHDALIGRNARDSFSFKGDKEEYQRRVEEYVKEYKNLIYDIANRFKKNSEEGY